MGNIDYHQPLSPLSEPLSLNLSRYSNQREFTLNLKSCSKLFVREFLGAGEPLIFLHGWGLDSRSWLPAMKLLAGEHACLAFDLPGHGNSSEDFPKIDPLEIAIDFLDSIDRPGILVGHSMGAQVAALASLARPDLVMGMVAVDANLTPTASSPSERWRMLRHFESEKGERVARSYFKGYCRNEVDIDLWAQLDSMLSDASLNAKRETLNWILQQNHYVEPQVPLSAIFSDLPVSCTCLKRLQERGWNVSIETIESSDHFLPLSNTGKIVEAIEHFHFRVHNLSQ